MSTKQMHLCNGCHGLMQKAINFNDFAIVSIKGSDYRIHFWYMSKSDVVNIMKKVNHYNFFLIIYKNE